MNYKKLLITPSVAREILQSNLANRRVSQSKLNTYYTDMIFGRWKQDTGDTIRISKTNKLLDGQHRLLAIIKSNISLEMVICTDLEDNVMPFIDTGKSRNATDVFKIEGIPNENKIPSSIIFYERLKKGVAISGGWNSYTNYQILQMYLERPEYWQTIVKKAGTWYHNFSKILPPSFIAGVYAYLQSKHGEKADLFMEMVFKGTDITNNSINLLRNRLIQDAMSKSKLSMEYRAALFIKTWNLFLQNKESKVLKYVPENESYPKAL